MSWDEVLKAAPPIVQAVSIAVTAAFAVISLRAWRTQLVGKRRFEIAEQAIVAVYKAKDALDWIRNGASFGGEATERPRHDRESEGDARLRDTYFVPFKRIKDTSDDFAELSKVRLLCKAYFGDEVVKKIEVLFQALTQVRLSARMLYDSVGYDAATLARQVEFYIDCKRQIWATGDDKDKLSASINAAVKELDAILSPHLK